MFLLKKELYPLVDDGIKRIRANDRGEASMWHSLELLGQELRNHAVPVRKEDLPAGRYGVLYFSKDATACRGGTMIPRNGDVYVTVWHYDGTRNFWQESAWGGVDIRTSPFGSRRTRPGDNLLIELP